MKRKDFTELKEKTLKDLKSLVWGKKADAQKAKMSVLAGREKNLKAFKNLRRDVAQIQTLIKEKEIMEKLQMKEVKGKGVAKN